VTYEARVQSSASAEDIQRLHDAVNDTCPVMNTLRLPIDVKRV
jgi:organic hydroperoxide reductase OsmC/OhrA